MWTLNKAPMHSATKKPFRGNKIQTFLGTPHCTASYPLDPRTPAAERLVTGLRLILRKSPLAVINILRLRPNQIVDSTTPRDSCF